jgi:hypothetical protein
VTEKPIEMDQDKQSKPESHETAKLIQIQQNNGNRPFVKKQVDHIEARHRKAELEVKDTVARIKNNSLESRVLK